MTGSLKRNLFPSLYPAPSAAAAAQVKASSAPPPVDSPRSYRAPAGTVRNQMILGFATLAVLVLGFGTWSVFSRLSGAVIAEGRVEVDSNRQTLQHPTGGSIAELLVQEGDQVAQGDVILRFDPAETASELAIVQLRFAELRARRARLEAERDGLDQLRFPDDLVLQSSVEPEVAEFMTGQQNLFMARIDMLAGERRQLAQRLPQIAAQVDGLNAQTAWVEQQLEIAHTDLDSRQRALDRGIGLREPVLSLQREVAQLNGRLAQIFSQRAEALERQFEVESSISQLDIVHRQEAIAELRETRVSEQEYAENREALSYRLSNLDLRAPVSGRVFGLTVFGVSAVVRPAEPVGYIIPDGQPMIISAQVNTIDVDQVSVAQPARMTFSAFSQRDVPELLGTVTRISADAYQDERTGISYYTAELVLDADQYALLNGYELVPGMPVQVFIETGARSPLDYLLEPVAVYFQGALRES